MNANAYLQSFGWTEGEALQKGGLKKPILVKHKKDTKGLGHDTKDTDVWWEKLFDGQLKSMEVSGSGSSISITQNQTLVVDHMRRETSALYKMFVKGVGLEGTVGKTSYSNAKDHIDRDEVAKVIDKAFGTISKEDKKEKKKKDKKKEKKTKKDKSNKVEKKDNLNKREKTGKVSKKDKKDKIDREGVSKKNEKKATKEDLVSESKSKSKKSDKKDKKEKKEKSPKETKSKKRRLDSNESEGSKKRRREL
ncbi:hypothetical protein PICST_32035 [Scheffersomyces stipitis CBS 6054]|uniref:G-patch domain-containing protein n=1 Tax=Scheffersomyces stipitis (strain ATCC 58785 / CBS 6054 / NBRC 10063 / NRRL Y-11545) TaxID=322104 RepID=A3LV93_PICST|nr:hypothetical protein PICST_32035 [Scheffersomyces stipitis CBS 6054]ABN67087.2 hypothetical protein PICST_32035 [Scheffersomyces stipitis CBS 6054]KAG2734869.1 hypothetical protein G9P44_002875 [Scheffersomyces stipitis]